MKRIVLLFAIVFPFSAFCQVGYFYNERMQIVDDSVNCFFRSAPYQLKGPDTLFTYYCSNDALRSREPKFDGLDHGDFEVYFPDGKLESKGSHVNGRPVGLNELWHSNGQKRAVVEFSDQPFKIHQYWDSTGHQLVTDGHGMCRCRFTNSAIDSVIQIGLVRNFFRDSTWIGLYNGSTKYIDEYENGNLVKGVSFDQEGNSYPYTQLDVAADPKDGMYGLYKFIRSNLAYPKAAKRHRDEGTVFVSFIVDKMGNLYDIKVIRGVSEECDAEAVRVVKAFPPWTPGLHRGQPVKGRFILPVKFKLK